MEQTDQRVMPSLQFFFFRSMMPFLKVAQARFRVQDIDTLVRFRERSERQADMLVSLPRRVRLENTKIGGVTCDWLIPQDAQDDPVIVFLHGRGIFFGWSNPNRRILAYIAKFSGVRAFGVDYRLPPNHCYPSAHDDCFTVYQTLVQQGKQIVLIGESSGGVLALAALLRAKAADLAQPSHCVLISPTVNYGFKDTRIWNSDDLFGNPRFIIELHKHYLAGNDTRSPDLGPVYADFSGLAPLQVLVTEHDILQGEAERLAKAARRHDLPMELTLWPHVWHGWHLFVPQLPEATRALKMLGGVIRQRTGNQ
ncbi:MAG: alpha/beta hydrolase [Anaerolineae bacterium]|nr:MAG: alpha/beta hydrolase [Anaerolineae bacterium]